MFENILLMQVLAHGGTSPHKAKIKEFLKSELLINLTRALKSETSIALHYECNAGWYNLFPPCFSPFQFVGSVSEALLRASSYEPGWPGWLGYRDEIGVCSYGDFSARFPRWKILKKWWRDHSGVKSNEQAWREFLDFLCLNNLKFLLTLR